MAKLQAEEDADDGEGSEANTTNNNDAVEETASASIVASAGKNKEGVVGKDTPNKSGLGLHNGEN